MTHLQKTALYCIAGFSFGQFMPRLIGFDATAFLIFLFIVCMTAQAILLMVGLRWIRRQVERYEAGQEFEPEPWYIQWNTLITGMRRKE